MKTSDFVSSRHDALYSNGMGFYGNEPNDYIMHAIQSIPMIGARRAADFGCGQGRNSIYLARKGLDVTAIDFSRVGLRQLKAYADEHGFKIQTVYGDLTESETYEKIPDDNDILVCTNVLHFIPRDKRPEVIQRISRKSAKGGLIIAHAITEETDGASLGWHPLRTGELSQMLADNRFDIFKYENVSGKTVLGNDAFVDRIIAWRAI